MNLNWDILLNVPSVGKAMQEGWDRGVQQREKRELQSALAAYANDPSDQIARRTIYTLNPQLGANLEDQSYQRAERTRAGEARSALSEMMLARGRTGPGVHPSSVQPQTSALNAVATPNGGVLDPIAASRTARPMTSRGSGPSPEPQTTTTLADVMETTPGTAPGLEARPSASSPAVNPGDPNWERFVRADPAGAMKHVLSQRELTKAENEALTSQMDLVGRLAASAVDQPSYAAALEQGRAMGVDVSMLPETFDPDRVNAIQLQALSAKELLAEQRQARRLDWDIRDDELDNDPADENTESQINYRGEQVRLGGERIQTTRRGQDLTDTRARRGQDLVSGDKRRGQDLSDARERRGQDMTDRRGRESASFTGAGRKPGRAGSSSARIINPQTGRAAILKNGAWVDEQTGKPLS